MQDLSYTHDTTVLDGARMPWPTPWDEVFGRQAPLVLEIGFGGGHFLVDLAAKRPEANIIGLEISQPSIRRAERKIHTRGLTNVRAMYARAEYMLSALCAPEQLSEVFVNFPDPWPKERHHGRRVISPHFLTLLATRMPAGAQLNIATDHPDYAPYITTCLEETPYFHSTLPTTYVTEDNERLRTKYELKAIDEGRTCHYYKWVRNTTPVPAAYPTPEEFPMPHAIVRSPLTLTEVAQHFSRQKFTGDIPVALLDIYQTPRDEHLLLVTHINEEPFPQRPGLIIQQRPTGELIIKLHEVGFPRPTTGVHRAIYYVMKWILNLHPDSELIYHNLRNLDEAESKLS